MKDDERISCVVLFSGTWVWAAHLVAAIRDFSLTGKSVLIWTHPGSQGWRPVGGLVMHGALKEVGIPHRFVYGGRRRRRRKWIASPQLLPRQPHEEWLNRLDPRLVRRPRHGANLRRGRSRQWMKLFGVDIDSRDTTELIRHGPGRTPAKSLPRREPRIQKFFGRACPKKTASTNARCGSTWPSRKSWPRKAGTFTRSSRSPAWATITAPPVLPKA